MDMFDKLCAAAPKCDGDMPALVRAVLETLRNPTRDMVVAGRKKPPEDSLRPGSADCDVNTIRSADHTTLRFQAMIDEVLK